jgi:hypothetical protein
MKLIAGTYFATYKLKPGTKVKFEEEKQAYTVRASNVAFAICTKPFNVRRTVLYTIIDWRTKMRGPENLVFGMGAETDAQCEEMLKRLTDGETEVSFRHGIPLKIESLKLPR